MENLKPSMYCGASSHHIHCENFEFKTGEKLLIFGRDEVDNTTTWLDLKNCTGRITPETFSLFTALDYINFEGCTLEFSAKAFAAVKNIKAIDIRESKVSISKEIFEDCETLESVHLKDLKIPDQDCFSPLKKLNMLTIEECQFENSNGNIFRNLFSLQYLIIERCELPIFGDVHQDLKNLEMLILMHNKIGELKCDGIFNLLKLKEIAIFNNETVSVINYERFQTMPLLETILFENNVYKTLDFRAFPSLKLVKIGTLTDVPTPADDELFKKFDDMNITYQFTFCGKIEVDMSKVMICA
ncbi:unnamed protein product [Diabrotica balteata]|uniref:Uncharacterized protein n=1 Tax=Diabrotica balteata TaxID=107213 RepID=A0A9N9SMZ1_DIABA|nr:unnamed protein product [Diabrotica balteata]